MIFPKRWGDRQIVVALSLAALFLFCLNLGNVPLRDWDEGTRGLIAREIFRTGNWLHPTQFGQPYMLKPPLMDWLMAISYHIGGVNEWTSRLPGTITSALGVPLLYCLGRELSPKSKRAASICSALIYLTLLPVVRHGRLAMLDGLVLTGMLLSFWCLLRSDRQKVWGLGFGLGLGIITLTKGLLMLPIGAIALIYVLWDRRWSVFKNVYIWLGLALGFLPSILWFGAQIHHYGQTFIDVHFLNQGFDRVADTVESHQNPPWFYLLEIVKYSTPWLFFLPQSYYYHWQNRATSQSRLVLAGSLFYLGLISVMGTKLPWYIMPLYPFLALALAHYFVESWQRKTKFIPLQWLFYLLAIATYGSVIYFILSDPQTSLIILPFVVGTMFLLAGWHWQWQHPNFVPILIIGMYCTLGLLFSSQSWLWEVNEAFPVKPIGEIIRTQTPEDTTVFTNFGYRRPSLNFYGDRSVVPQSLSALDTDQYWLIGHGEFESIKNKISPYQVLGETAEFKLLHIQN